MAAPNNVTDLLNNALTNEDRLRSDSNVITCDLYVNCCSTLIDDINAAWNGWEQACKFQDEDKQAYYMKYIVILQETLNKIRKHEAVYYK